MLSPLLGAGRTTDTPKTRDDWWIGHDAAR